MHQGLMLSAGPQPAHSGFQGLRKLNLAASAFLFPKTVIFVVVIAAELAQRLHI